MALAHRMCFFHRFIHHTICQISYLRTTPSSRYQSLTGYFGRRDEPRKCHQKTKKHLQAPGLKSQLNPNAAFTLSIASRCQDLDPSPAPSRGSTPSPAASSPWAGRRAASRLARSSFPREEDLRLRKPTMARNLS